MNERRKHAREAYNDAIEFVVLEETDAGLDRKQAHGTIMDISRVGIGIQTRYALQAGHVVEWDDKHEKGKLHIALVKWSRKIEDFHRAGLLFI
jgi:hypothetical protein